MRKPKINEDLINFMMKTFLLHIFSHQPVPLMMSYRR